MIQLPPGWEAKQDPQGNTYYVDHINQKSQWTPPDPVVQPVGQVVQPTTTTTTKRVVVREAEREDTCGQSPERCGYTLFGVETVASIILMILQGTLLPGAGWVSTLIIWLIWSAIILGAIMAESQGCLGCVGVLNIIACVVWGFYALVLAVFAIVAGAAGYSGASKLWAIFAVVLILCIFKAVTAAYWFRIAMTIKTRRYQTTQVTTTTVQGGAAIPAHNQNIQQQQYVPPQQQTYAPQEPTYAPQQQAYNPNAAGPPTYDNVQQGSYNNAQRGEGEGGTGT